MCTNNSLYAAPCLTGCVRCSCLTHTHGAGYNSRMALYVLDEFLNSFGGGRIKLATVGFGTNDAAVKTGK